MTSTGGRDAFWTFCVLRQLAYWRRERNEGPPYSDDPAIARYHFCNLYREADRGTRWFQQRRPRGDARTVIEASLIYRPVNRVSTFESWGGLPMTAEAPRFATWLRHQMGQGEKVFTGRHMVRGPDYPALTRAIARGDSDDVADAACAADIRDVVRAVRRLPGIGQFFAWQVACDALESGALTRSAAESAEEWVLLGPGATAGARLVSDGDPLDVARSLRDESGDRMTVDPPEGTPEWSSTDCWLSLKNVEHALCEFARYVRATDATRAAGLEVKPWARR